MQGLPYYIFHMPEVSLARVRENGTTTSTTTTTTTTTTTPRTFPPDATLSPLTVHKIVFDRLKNSPFSWISMDEMKDKLNRANHSVSKITVRKPTPKPTPEPTPEPFLDRVEDWLLDDDILPTIAPTAKPTITKATTTALPYMTTSLGTRTFIPALVSFVALLSFAMILVAICRVIVHPSRRKKRKRPENKIEDGSKLTTLLPTAPPQEDHSGPNVLTANTAAFDPTAPPPDYEMLFGSTAEGAVEAAKSVTDVNSRYLPEIYPKENENLMPLKPLLDSAHTVNECENCGHSTSPRTTQL